MYFYRNSNSGNKSIPKEYYEDYVDSLIVENRIVEELSIEKSLGDYIQYMEEPILKYQFFDKNGKSHTIDKSEYDAYREDFLKQFPDVTMRMVDSDKESWNIPIANVDKAINEGGYRMWLIKQMKLAKLSDNNKKYKTTIQDIIDLMFDYLKSRGFAKGKGIEEFREYMLAPGDLGYKNRSLFFQDLRSHGLTNLISYEDFIDWFGLSNTGLEKNVEKLGSENRRKLYINLINDGFDLGSFKDFDRNMADKTIRRNIYNAAKEAGWEMPDYDQYEADMKIYRIGTKGNMKEVSRSEYNDFIKRHQKDRK